MHSHRFVPFFVACCAAAFACSLAVACAPSDRATAGVVVGTDAFGDSIRVGVRPQRIVSLNPATTELVFALGAGGRLVGRTRWDSYPDSARRVHDVGDGMRPNIEAVLATKPDLVLLYASGENKPARDAFRRNGIATLTQRIDRVADFAEGVVMLGRVLGDTTIAIVVRDSVLASLERARTLARGLTRPRVLWPLWEAPLMSVGRGSFLNELIEIAGGENIFGDIAAPSPQVTFEEVVRRDPDIILTGSDASVIRTDPRWRALRAVREHHVITYDTAIVSRPGVRLGEAAVHLAHLMHPELKRTP